VFRLDSSIIPAGQNAATVQVFRNGAVVADCGAGTGASPDPCVAQRTTAGDDISLTILTSHGSRWNFGRTTTNTAPVATSDTYSVCKNAALNVAAPGVLANDSDADHNTLTAVLVTGPSHAASFTLNRDGSFAYTPAAGYSGADSFTYAPNDGTTNGNTVAVTINITAVPTPSISGPATFCSGTSATLTSSSTSGNQWYLNGAAITGATGQTYAASTAGTYTVVATNGCASATSAPFSLTAATTAPPAINGLSAVTTGTTGNTATTPVGGAGYGYAWSIAGNGTITSGATAQTVTYTAGATGSLTLTLTVTTPAGCSSSNSMTVTVNPQPTIPIDNPTVKAPAKGATTVMTFTVTLSNASSQVVTVAFQTSSNTAVTPTDYIATSGTATFPAGSTTQTIPVTINGTGATTTKTFWMNLTKPTNATTALVAGFPILGKGTINP